MGKLTEPEMVPHINTALRQGDQAALQEEDVVIRKAQGRLQFGQHIDRYSPTASASRNGAGLSRRLRPIVSPRMRVATQRSADRTVREKPRLVVRRSHRKVAVPATSR